MGNSRMIITGATGFVGRHLLEAFGDDFDIWALSRGSPSLRGASLPANARWLPVDIARPQDVGGAFETIRQAGGADVIIHLAGHYDFTGERDPEYHRTNVEGMRNVLDAGSQLGVHDVVFASSVAACDFPREAEPLTERSPPDGDTPYAESKRMGEAMMAQYRGKFRGWNVRFAALFSDWCEYEPLFRFIETWLSRRPRSRILAGHGLSAIPYLHIRDAATFVRCLLERRDELCPETPLLASLDGAISHLEIFEAATGAHFGERVHPLLIPRPVCRSSLWATHLIGRATGLQIFERPWMGRMIDLRLSVDASKTRERLGWAPRARLGLIRRLPFLIQNRKSFGAEWHRRNHTALRSVRRYENLQILRLLERRMTEIAESLADYVLEPKRAMRFPRLRTFGSERLRADNVVLLGALVESVRTGEKAFFRSCCHELARKRLDEGLPFEELTAALDVLNDLCVLSLAEDRTSRASSLALYDHITMTVQFGVDEILDVFEK